MIRYGHKFISRGGGAEVWGYLLTAIFSHEGGYIRREMHTVTVHIYDSIVNPPQRQDPAEPFKAKSKNLQYAAKETE